MKMKAIKQKDQSFTETNMRLETVLDGVLYHPLNRKYRQWKYRTGRMLKRFRRIRGITRKKFGTIADLDLHFTGVSHLDAAWLFPVLDTKIRAYKTFYKAIEHCDEFPFLVFAQTTPQYYNWIKRYDSELYEKIKEYVSKGRLEPTGGMWIEPSLDMPMGEALVRQRLFGQLFYLREFGFYPTLSSLLDVFGFPHSLPQILRKSGAEYFWTTKVMANDYSGWPFSFFIWRGIDGSDIFTFTFTYNWDALSNNGRFRKNSRYPAEGFEGSVFNSHNFRKEIEEKFSNKPDDWNHKFPVFYGLGDGGRGPLELEIMYADSLKQLHDGVHTSQHDYFNTLRDGVADRYFIWDDEMYLEYHRGCKTTQLEVKHYNRYGELWANALEAFLVSKLMLSTPKNSEKEDTATYYPKEEVFEVWRRVLFNQFHDILPGSSIPDVYVLAVKEQKEAINDAKKIIQSGLESVIRNSAGVDGTLLLFNPHGWSFSGYIPVGDRFVYFEDVSPLSFMSIKQKQQIEQASGDNSLVTGNNAQISKANGENAESINHTASHLVNLENDRIRATISIKTGNLISLVYKKRNPGGYDLLRGDNLDEHIENLNENIKNLENSDNQIKSHIAAKHVKKDLQFGFRAYHEKPKRWPAWNLDKYYPKKQIPIELVKIEKVDEIELLDGESKKTIKQAGIKSTFKFLNSKLSITYFLRENDDYLNLSIKSDLKDPMVLIKLFIPLNLKSDEVYSEIPYAWISRKRIKQTEKERGKWEMNMQKWLDVSDDDVGLAVLNNNRYGFSATSLGVYVTLTRTAIYPGVSPLYGSTRILPKDQRPKYTDMKPFYYMLGLYPHDGQISKSEITKKAFNFNFPPLVLDKTGVSENDNLNRLGKAESFIEISNPDILIGSLKASEWIDKSDVQNTPIKKPDLTDKERSLIKTRYKSTILYEDYIRDYNQVLAENGNWSWEGTSFILRLVENGGSAQKTAIKFHNSLEITEIEEVNLLEMNPVRTPGSDQSVATGGNSISLDFKPFEIKTLKISLKNR